MEAVFSDATVFLFRDASANELQVVHRNLWEQQCCERLNLYVRSCSCGLYKAMFCSVFFSLQTLKEAAPQKTVAVKFYNNKRKYRSNPQIT